MSNEKLSGALMFLAFAVIMVGFIYGAVSVWNDYSMVTAEYFKANTELGKAMQALQPCEPINVCSVVKQNSTSLWIDGKEVITRTTERSNDSVLCVWWKEGAFAPKEKVTK